MSSGSAVDFPPTVPTTQSITGLGVTKVLVPLATNKMFINCQQKDLENLWPATSTANTTPQANSYVICAAVNSEQARVD